MALEKNQPAEESLETKTTITPTDSDANNSELKHDEAEKIAGGFIVRE